MNGELLRLVDALHREKDIEKEILFEAIEGAIASAVKKRHNPDGEIDVKIDRQEGQITISENGQAVNYPDMGRIQAQTAKQVIIQKIREAERDVIYADYENKVGEIVNGNVQRIEGGNVIVNLGRAEGILLKSEKIRGENYQPGDRIKALISDVKKVGQKVKILLTRASPDLVVRLFELEVPEIGEKIIEIRRIAREPGYRTKIAVSSYDMRVDCIGACVGIRGSRIKSITDELNDEKIDIIRWNDSAEVLIINALKPAQISSMVLDEENKVAQVTVPDDMLSLAIGRKGQNVRLATKLTGWDIRIQGASGATPTSAADPNEDPVVTGVREALLQGTSFEGGKNKVETRGKDAPTGEAPAAVEPPTPEEETPAEEAATRTADEAAPEGEEDTGTGDTVASDGTETAVVDVRTEEGEPDPSAGTGADDGAEEDAGPETKDNETATGGEDKS